MFPQWVFGGVFFSEIMYDLEGSDTNEWVEVQNIGNEDIDISTWKLFENNVNHGLKIFNGEIVLKVNGYAIIANDANAFLNAYPGYLGNVFDSAYTLANSGEMLVLRDANNKDIDTVSYVNTWGASGDGKTLQKISEEWKANQPTPGGQNSWSSSGEVLGESTTTDTQTPASKNPEPKILSIYSSPVREFEFDEPVFQVDAGPDRLTAVGNSLQFKAETIERNLNEGRGNSFVWSFGDGSIKNGQVVSYQYRHAGEYVVVVNAQKGQFESAAQAFVKVVEPDLSFVQDIQTGNITVINAGEEDVNLYGWKLTHLGSNFEFPKDTIIKSGASITLSKEVTLLSLRPNVTPIVTNPLGTIYISKKSQSVKEVNGVNEPNVKTSLSDLTSDSAVLEAPVEYIGENAPVLDDKNPDQTLLNNQKNSAEEEISGVVLGEQRSWWTVVKDFFIRFVD